MKIDKKPRARALAPITTLRKFKKTRDIGVEKYSFFSSKATRLRIAVVRHTTRSERKKIKR